MFHEITDSSFLLDRLHAGLVIHAADSSVVYANPRALSLLNLSEEQILGLAEFPPEWGLVDEDGRRLDPAQYPVSLVLKSGAPVAGRILGIVHSCRADPVWVVVHAVLGQGALGEVQVVVNFMEVSDRDRIPFRDIVDLASDAVVVADVSNMASGGAVIVYVNRAFECMTGYAASEVLGRTPRMLQGPDTERAALDRVRAAVLAKRPTREVLLNYTKFGQPYWLELNLYPLVNHSGLTTHYVAIQRDITTQHEERLRLKSEAIQDALTGLLNRRGFYDHAPAAIRKSSDSEKGYALISVDIDFFKRVNDRFGHPAGDTLLRALADEIRNTFRPGDVLARFGGEEFVILLTAVNPVDALSVGERFRSRVEKQLKNPEGQPVTVSLGIAQHLPGESLEVTIARSDQALYAAKQNGRNRVEQAPEPLVEMLDPALGALPGPRAD